MPTSPDAYRWRALPHRMTLPTPSRFLPTSGRVDSSTAIRSRWMAAGPRTEVGNHCERVIDSSFCLPFFGSRHDQRGYTCQTSQQIIEGTTREFEVHP